MYRSSVVLLIISLLVLPACVPTIFLRAAQDLQQGVNKNGKLFLAKEDEMSIEEKNFSLVLFNELKNSELKITDNLASADYVLSYQIFDLALIGQVLNYEPEIIGNFCYADPNITSRFSVGYIPVSSLYAYPAKKIVVKLFIKQEYLKPRHSPIWEGNVIAEQEVYRQNINKIIFVIANYLGKIYEGKVDLR